MRKAAKRIAKNIKKANAGRTRKILYGEAKARGLRTESRASRAKINKLFDGVKPYEFYSGIEWLACWLLDHAEGETITEEQLRPWAAEAWKAHLKRQNDQAKQEHARQTLDGDTRRTVFA